MYILFELLQLLLGERIRLADQGNQVHLQYQQQWATGQNLKLVINGIFFAVNREGFYQDHFH